MAVAGKKKPSTQHVFDAGMVPFLRYIMTVTLFFHHQSCNKHSELEEEDANTERFFSVFVQSHTAEKPQNIHLPIHLSLTISNTNEAGMNNETKARNMCTTQQLYYTLVLHTNEFFRFLMRVFARSIASSEIKTENFENGEFLENSDEKSAAFINESDAVCFCLHFIIIDNRRGEGSERRNHIKTRHRARWISSCLCDAQRWMGRRKWLLWSLHRTPNPSLP